MFFNKIKIFFKRPGEYFRFKNLLLRKIYLLGRKMYQVLKRLLNEGTQEYNEIKNKILEMEKIDEK